MEERFISRYEHDVYIGHEPRFVQICLNVCDLCCVCVLADEKGRPGGGRRRATGRLARLRGDKERRRSHGSVSEDDAEKYTVLWSRAHTRQQIYFESCFFFLLPNSSIGFSPLQPTEPILQKQF